MATSQNGFVVLEDNATTGPQPRLRKWRMANADRHFYARDGSAGFLLIHMASWFDDEVEVLDREQTWDDWGWAVRPVRGQTSGYSNHASGTALDLNATKHPRGVATRQTFSQAEIDKIHRHLHVYDGCIRWGGDYSGTPDGMHFEINKDLAACEVVARRFIKQDNKRGMAILDANPGAKQVILS